MPFNADPYISKTPGFPKEGITFYDISPILEDSAVVREAMDALADLARPMKPDLIAGVDARGFLFALPLALDRQESICAVRFASRAHEIDQRLGTTGFSASKGKIHLLTPIERELTQ